MFIATIIEIIIAVLLIIGFIYEDKIATLEKRFFNWLQKIIKK